MPFEPGQLVVKKWSKAKHLRGKIYRIVGKVPLTGYQQQYRMVAPSGRQVEIGEYSIRSLEDELTRYQHHIFTAQSRLADAQNDLNHLRRDIEECRKLFPVI